MVKYLLKIKKERGYAMNFTKYYFKYPLSNSANEYYIVHTLLACIDILSESDNAIIDKWISCPDIVPDGENEEILFDQLQKRGYIVTPDDEIEMYNDAKNYCLKKRTQNAAQDDAVCFALTYQCNFKCPYCYEQNNNKSTSILTTEMVDKVFELKHDQISHIMFYGGEPFLPCNMDTIKYIIQKAPNSTYAAITNGYCLDEFIDILKKVKVTFLQVTLDGDETIHNQTRVLKNGQPTFSKIIANIDKCLEENIPIKIRMNISSSNVDSCIKLREELIKKYLGKPLTFELQPIFQLDPDLRNTLSDKISESDNATKHLFRPDTFDYNTILYTYSPIMMYLLSKQKTFYPICNNCDAETSRRFYDADGDIYSCILSVGNKNAAIGTYFPEFKMKETSLITRTVFTIEKCNNCNLAFLCGGGCAYGMGASSGNMNQPNCSNITNTLTYQIPQLLRNLQQQKVSEGECIKEPG